jgi:hypothetical protein
MPAVRRLRSLAAAVLAAALGWSAWWLGVELSAVRQEVLDPPNPGAVAEWSLATPRAESLERFLAAARTRLPPDRVVAFTAGSGQHDQEFFLTLWAAYLLPDQRVLRLDALPDASGADYVLAYNTELADPRLVPAFRHPSGWLYLVRPAGTAPPRADEAPP